MTEAAAIVSTRSKGLVPVVGLILGSGLDAVAEAITVTVEIAYADLPGFPEPTVQGHAGRMILGTLAGVPIACLRGRVHLYEGRPASAVLPLVRTLLALGCRALVLTNAAGSLRPEVGPGSVVAIADHINLMGTNPLVGPNDDAVGPRFVDLSAVYDQGLRTALASAAARLGVPLPSGVYLGWLGPCFETSAEIRAFRALGADLVGMSTVPEAIAARHCGLKVAGLSIVTNLAAGMTAEPLSHAETLNQAGAAAAAVRDLLVEAMPEIAGAA